MHRPEKSDILNPESISNFLGKGENGMEHLYEKALESAEYIKTHTKKRPKIAVVLGSGLGKLTADFTDTEDLVYGCLFDDVRIEIVAQNSQFVMQD